MSRKSVRPFMVVALLLSGALQANGISVDWNPSGPTPTWNSATTGAQYWLNGVLPSFFASQDTAVFGATGVGTVNVDSTSPVQVGGIKFNVAGYTVQANVLGDQLNMGGTTTSGNIDVGQTGPIAGSATIRVPLVYAPAAMLPAAPVWTVYNAGDSLLVTGTVDLAGNNLTLSGAGNLTISGDITGGGALAKAGAGTLTLSGNNGLDGASTLSMTAAGGTLLLGSDNALGGTFGAILDFGGGKVGAVGVHDIANSWTATGSMNIVGAGTLKLSSVTPVSMASGGPRTLDVAAGATVQVAAPISLGANTLNVTGGGTAALSGIDSAAGGATIAVNGGGNYTFGGAITSGGAAVTLSLAGGGTTTLAAANAGLGGATTVGASHTLKLGDNAALGSAALVFAGGNVVALGGNRTMANNWSNTGAINTTGTFDFTATGRTMAAGTVVTAASGTTAFSGDNLTLAGAVSLQGDGGIALGALTPTNIATTHTSYAITIGGAGAREVRGNLTTAVPLVLDGGGSLVLRGSNAHTATTVAPGNALIVTNNGALGAGKVTLDGSTLQFGVAGGIAGRYYNQTPANVGGVCPDFASLSALSALTNALTPAVTALTNTGGNAQFDFRSYWSGQQGNIFHSQGFNGQYNYIVRYDGYLDVPVAGSYNFWTGSDDCTVLFLDGGDAPVVNNNFFQGYTERGTAAPVTLSAGRHAITVAMNQGGGDAGFTVSWDYGGTRQLLSNAFLTMVDAANAPTALTAANAVDVLGNATIDLTNTVAGSAYSFGTLTPSGSASLTVNGTNRTVSFASTTLPAGTAFTLAGSSHVGLGALGGSVIAFNKSNTGNVTYSGTLSVGSGGLIVAGGNLSGGTLSVAGPIVYTGGAAATIGGTAVNVSAGGGTIDVAKGTAPEDLTIAAPLAAGATAIVKQGLGRLALAGNGGSTGGITVHAGSLRLSGADPIGAGAIALKNNTTLIPGALLFTPGLQEGRILSSNAGGLDTTTANPANSLVRLGTRQGDSSVKDGAFVANAANARWWDYETWAYTGKFFDADGVCSFAANIDDSWSIRIDGALYQSQTGNSVWTTGILNLGPGIGGWHDIDIRFANGGGGAGVTRTANGWVANSIGSGYNPAGSASSNFSDGYIRTVDPGDGSLFRVITGYTPLTGTAANDILVEGNATVDLAQALYGATAITFRNLLPSSNAGLAVSGQGLTLGFAGTTVPAAGFTVSGDGQLALGQIALAGATGTINVQTTGAGGAQMNYNTAPSSLAGLTVNVAAGARLGAVAGAADPTGGAQINLANNGIFQVASTASGTVPVLARLALGGNAIIEHAGAYTDALGDATHGINAGTGTLTLNGLAGTLILGGDISGTPTVNKSGAGTMQLKGVLAGGGVNVNAGTFQLGASNRIADAIPVTVNNSGRFDLNNYSDAIGAVTVNSGGSVTVGNGVLSPASITLPGGTIQMDSGGTLVMAASNLQIPVGATARPMILGGTWLLPLGSTAYAFNVPDGPAPIDLTVSSALVGTGNSLVKNGAGTLFLAGANTFGGGIAVNAGGIAVNSDAALGATANSVRLNGTALKFVTALINQPTNAFPTNYQINSSRTVTIDNAAGGTIDVSYDAGYNQNNVALYRAITYANPGAGGTGALVKTGWGNLNLRGSTASADAPTKVVVDRGTMTLSNSLALGVAAPNVAVNRLGYLDANTSTNYDLSNATTSGWTYPNYSPGNAAHGEYVWDWNWYAGRVRVSANIGNDAAAKFPVTPVTGFLDLNSDQGAATSAMLPANMPKMAAYSTLGVRNNYYIDFSLNGLVWVNGVGASTLYGVLKDGAAAGGMIRVGNQDMTIRAPQTFTGPAILDTANSTWLVSNSATVHGSLATTDVQVLSGNLQPDDSVNNNPLNASRFAAGANIKMYGGQLREKGKDAAVADEVVNQVTLIGSPTVSVERVNAFNVLLKINTLTRNAGSTVNFTAAGGGTLGATNTYVNIGGGAGALTAAVTPWAYVNNLDWAVYDTANAGQAAEAAAWLKGVKVFAAYTTTWPAAGGSATADMKIAASQTVGSATVATVNSLLLNGSGTLTLDVPLTITSGGILQNAASGAGNWTIAGGTGNNGIVTGTTGNAELVVYNNNQIDLNAPVGAAGLTKTGAGILVLYANATVPPNYNGGEIHVNAGELNVRTPNAIGNSGKIVVGGGTLNVYDDVDAAFGNNIDLVGSATTIRARQLATGGKRFGFGNLFLEQGRTTNIRSDNNDSMSFANVTLGGANYVNLDGAATQRWLMGTGGTVTMNGPVWLNLWNGDSNWGQLAWGGSVTEADKHWSKSGAALMSLDVAAASGYKAAVDHTGGTLVLNADGALGAGTGTAASTVNVYASAYLNFGMQQTTASPTVNVSAYGAIGGNVGTDAAVFDSGANKINLPPADAIFVQNLTAVPARPVGTDWLGLSNTAAATTTVDPTASLYKGIALGYFTSNDVAADLVSAAGDLAIYNITYHRLYPASSTAVQNLNSATGVVNVYGPGQFRFGSNGGNGVQGSFAVVNRYGNGNTQNTDILSFADNVSSLRPGKTVNATDGRIRVYNNSATVAAGATVNVNTGATLYLADVGPSTGTFNIAGDAAVWINNVNRLSSGATFNFAAGSQVVLNTDLVPMPSFPTSVDVIIDRNNDAADLYTGAGVVLGEGRRLTTGWNNDARMGLRGTNLGAGFSAAPGAANITVSAANGRTFYFNDYITVPAGVNLSIGDAATYVTVSGNGDTTRRFATQDGGVQFDKLTVAAGATLKLVNGGTYLMENVAGNSFVLDGLIDDSLRKPITYMGGGPLFRVNAGRDGNPANFVTGAGTVKLGQGEDFEMMVDEIGAAATVAAPARMNVFQPRVQVLGTNESAVAAGVTGVLRAVRGTDAAGNYAIARFSNVSLNANAILGLAANDAETVMADLTLLGDATVRSQNGTAGRVLIGGIGTASGDGFNRTVTLGANGTGFDNPIDLVGPLWGKTYVVSNSSAATRLTRQSLDGGTTYFSTFSLGGRTLELRGVGNTDVLVDPGAGNLTVNNGTLNHRYAYDTTTNPNTVVTLNNGTFNIDANRTVGSFIYNGGSFTYTAGMDLTVQHRLGGSGAVVDASAARLTLAAGAGLAPGPDRRIPGTLVLGSPGSAATNLTLPANFAYDWKFGMTGNDKVAVNGGLAFAGTTPGALNVTPLDDTSPASSYVVLSWSGADPAVLPSAWNVNAAASPVAAPVVRWKGTNGAWGTPSNWSQVEYVGGTVVEYLGSATDGIPGGTFVLTGLAAQPAATPTITADSAIFMEPANTFSASGPAAPATVRSLVLGNANSAGQTASLVLGNTFTVTENVVVRPDGVLNVGGQFNTPLLSTSGQTNFNAGAVANVTTMAVASGTASFNSGAAGSISTVNVTGGTAAFNNGATTAVNSLNVKGTGTATLNNASVNLLTVTGGGVTVTGPNARVNAAAVSAGVVNTQTNQLTVQTSLTLGNVNFSVTGAPQFAVQGSDLNNATVGRTITVSGGTLKVAGQWLTLGAASADVGGPGKAGSTTASASVNGAAFTVNGGGADIWGGADQCQFVYRQVTGDFDVSVNVVSQLYTDVWAKTGLMARNSLAANSAVADMVVTPSSGVAFQWRVNDGDGTSVNSVTGGIAAPRKIRLQRVGNAFTAYYETPGGGGWTQQGTAQTLNVGSTMYLGLAVTAHANSTLSSVVFDSAFDVDPIVNLPATHFAVTQDSALNAASSSPAVLGGLELAGSTLTLAGAPSYGFSGLSVSGSSGLTGGRPIEFRGGSSSTTNWVVGANLTLNGLAGQRVKFNLAAGSTASVAAGARPSVTVEPGAALELTGAVSGLGDAAAVRFVDVVNNSRAANTGLRITGVTTQEVGAIGGTGTTTVGDGTNAAALIADSIVQDTLVIGAGSRVVIAVRQPATFNGTAKWAGLGGNTAWSNNDNWIDGGGVKQAPGIGAAPTGHLAQFSTIAGSSTAHVSLGTVSVNLKQIAFSGNTAYTVGQTGDTGAITMQTTGGNASITVAGTKSHVISAPLHATGNLDLLQTETATLTLGNIVNSATLSVGGTVGVDGIAGAGTTNVSGHLTADSIVQGTLVIGAGGSVTIRPTTGAADGAHAVPEPGTCVLMIAAAGCLLGSYVRRRLRL